MTTDFAKQLILDLTIISIFPSLQALTEASLLELERVWETNFSDEEEDDDHMQTDEGIMPVPNAPGHVHQGGSDLPVQQQLFYETTGGFSQEQSAP